MYVFLVKKTSKNGFIVRDGEFFSRACWGRGMGESGIIASTSLPVTWWWFTQWPTGNLPSLKLTAKAPKNWWLDNEFPFGMAQPGFRVRVEVYVTLLKLKGKLPRYSTKSLQELHPKPRPIMIWKPSRYPEMGSTKNSPWAFINLYKYHLTAWSTSQVI